MKTILLTIAIFALFNLNEVIGQWNTNGNHIYNTNAGYVGIGTNTPATLLHVGKNMTEPNIMVQNQGGSGGATFTMKDDASGANWKFKATLTGGFKIRDHANGLDVIVIEPGSFANAIYIKSTDNIGICTANPNNSALLELNSSSKGFLIPRMTISQIEAITNPADGLQVYCTTEGKLYIFVASAGEWKEVSFGITTITPPFECGNSIIVNHIDGNVAPVTKTVTYNTVTGVNGEPDKCWISSNLGSDHQAFAVNDTTEASAGWYWQFNRMKGYRHYGTTTSPVWSITWIDENSNWLVINDPCALEIGNEWRLPTYTEWFNLDENGNWTTWIGPWNSDLKLHAAGHLNGSYGLIVGRGTNGYYWSSTQYANTTGYFLGFAEYDCWPDGTNKANGFPVRCIKD